MDPNKREVLAGISPGSGGPSDQRSQRQVGPRGASGVTNIHSSQGGEELEVVERGCAHPEKTNRTMSYRIGMQIISLTETVCESNMCNQPRPGE